MKDDMGASDRELDEQLGIEADERIDHNPWRSTSRRAKFIWLFFVGMAVMMVWFFLKAISAPSGRIDGPRGDELGDTQYYEESPALQTDDILEMEREAALDRQRRARERDEAYVPPFRIDNFDDSPPIEQRLREPRPGPAASASQRTPEQEMLRAEFFRSRLERPTTTTRGIDSGRQEILARAASARGAVDNAADGAGGNGGDGIRRAAAGNGHEVHQTAERLLPGDLLFAESTLAYDSYAENRLRLRIITGPLRGAILTGRYERTTDFGAVIKTTHIAWNGNYGVFDAVVLDVDTGIAAYASRIDRYTVRRIGAALLQGIARTGRDIVEYEQDVTVVPGTDVVIRSRGALAREEIAALLVSNAGQAAEGVLTDEVNRPARIRINAGDHVALMIEAPVDHEWLPSREVFHARR